MAREKETLSLVRESRDRGKIVGQRPGRQRARVPANYEADTADKRSESTHAICIPRRETIVPSILWLRKFYEDGEMRRMRSKSFDIREDKPCLCLTIHPFLSC